jgi:hypothetical protein
MLRFRGDCFLLNSRQMLLFLNRMKLDKSARSLRRSLRYAFYDWTRELPRRRRIIIYVCEIFQGYAFYFIVMWAFTLPRWLSSNLLLLPRRPVSYVLVFLFFISAISSRRGCSLQNLSAKRNSKMTSEQRSRSSRRFSPRNWNSYRA